MNEPIKKPRPLWLRILRGLLLLIVILVVVFIVVGMFVLDGKYAISREITIKAQPATVHRQVGDLREWPNWLPFTKHDKTIKVNIVQPTGVGANQDWTGESGNGELKFTSSDEEKGIEFDMLFEKKWASKGAITYSPVGDETQVKWSMQGQNTDFMGKWMALAFPYMMPSMFDEGLKDLKNKVEGK